MPDASNISRCVVILSRFSCTIRRASTRGLYSRDYYFHYIFPSAARRCGVNQSTMDKTEFTERRESNPNTMEPPMRYRALASIYPSSLRPSPSSGAAAFFHRSRARAKSCLMKKKLQSSRHAMKTIRESIEIGDEDVISGYMRSDYPALFSRHCNNFP